MRGNHDHEITSEMVAEVFGDKVIFVPGILIMEITEDEHVYRIR